MSKASNAYYRKYYNQLQGAKINHYEGMASDPYGGEGMPMFHAILADGTSVILVIQADAEGNGGGHIAGLPTPPN